MQWTKGRGPDPASTPSEPRRTARSHRDDCGQDQDGRGPGDGSPGGVAPGDHGCRKGGTLSVPGVYIGAPDKVPFGALMNKALTVKTGQTHVQRYLKPLLERIEKGDIDPSFVITHERPLSEGPELYKTFRDKEDGCIKVVLKPGASAVAQAA